MTLNDYSYEDAVAAIRLIYEGLPNKKKAEMSSYLIDLLCYMRLTSPAPIQRMPLPYPDRAGNGVLKG